MPVLLAGAILGCGRGGRAIRIGALVPLTGEVASFGVSTRNGYELAVQEWNARGGVLGRPLELSIRDDQGNPAQGLDALTRLVEHDRIVALLGASLSKVSYVAAPIVQSLGIPMISPTSSDPKLTAIGDHIYRVCCTDRAQGDAAAAFAFQDLRARRAACIYDMGSVYPAELAQAFKSKFMSLGGKMVAYQDHPTGAISTAAQITRVVRAHPDILYIPDYYADAVLIAKEARAQGFKGTLMGGDGWDAPALAHRGGLEAGYFTCNFSRDEDRPIVQDFVRKYRERYHMDPDSSAALAYDAGNVLFDAIRRAGATDGPTLNEALSGTDFSGVSGQIKFDLQRNPVKPPLIIEIKGGRMLYRGKIAL
jgi:branched-chain amino acid transport system substrate-binding protein